ncbi:MAG: hypothetical protein WAL25_08985 [Acidimicrobiia bacterium]
MSPLPSPLEIVQAQITEAVDTASSRTADDQGTLLADLLAAAFAARRQTHVPA